MSALRSQVASVLILLWAGTARADVVAGPPPVAQTEALQEAASPDEPVSSGSANLETASVPGGLAEPPALDPPGSGAALAEAERIGKRLRCPVCQGLSVADSNAEAARAMYKRIFELVQLGYSGEQIEDYFIDRYGEWVLLSPKKEGLHWIIWVGPVLVLVVGAGLVALRAREQDAADTAPRPPTQDAEDDPYRRQILAELGDDEGASNG